jgi:hypothetical protein
MHLHSDLIHEDDQLSKVAHFNYAWHGSIYTALGCIDRLRYQVHSDMDKGDLKGHT